MNPTPRILLVAAVLSLSVGCGQSLKDFGAEALEVHCQFSGDYWFHGDCRDLAPQLNGRAALTLTGPTDGKNCSVSSGTRATLNGKELPMIQPGSSYVVRDCNFLMGPCIESPRCLSPVWAFDIPTEGGAVFEITDGETVLRAGFPDLFNPRTATLLQPSEPEAADGDALALQWSSQMDSCQRADVLFYSSQAVPNPQTQSYPRGSLEIWPATVETGNVIRSQVALEPEDIRDTGRLVVRASCDAAVAECTGVAKCSAITGAVSGDGIQPGLTFTLR